ncbi:MAG: type IV toxin-antitoxin system AbiEi family antitoxin domain-containing protein [bacterium]
MKAIDANRRLRDAGGGAFGTADASVLLGMTSSHASRVLERLCEAGQVVRLKRGVWAFPDRLEPLQVPEHLAAPLPCYVSLQSALFYHGLISQIPHVVYAVSTARTRRWTTPLATVSIHHLNPAFFFGFEVVGNGTIKMATPEKALLDCLYLSPAKSRLFASLPELDLHDAFDLKAAHRLLNQVPSAGLRTTLLRRMAMLQQGSR